MNKFIASIGFLIALYLILHVWFHQSVNFSIGWAGLISGLIFTYLSLEELKE